MNRTIPIFFLLLFCLAAGGQQARQYSFKHFSVLNGLASNTVHDVEQDKDGFIWFATANGLQRYDGSSFLVFRSGAGNASNLPGNSVGEMYIDRKKRLWLMFAAEEVGIFDTRTFSFKKVRTAPCETKNWIGMHMRELANGELVLFRGGLDVLRYDEEKEELVRADGIVGYPQTWKPNDIRWDARIRRYWITCDSGLVQYDPLTRHVNYRGHNMDDDPVIASAASIMFPIRPTLDHDGNVIFVYWPSDQFQPTLARYHRRNSRLEKALLWDQLKVGYHEVADLLVQRNGRVWVYGLPFLAEWLPNSITFESQINAYKHEHSLKFDHAENMMEDREGNLWLATDNGVFLFNPDQQIFNTYSLIRPGEKVLEPPVQATAELKDGRLFVGTWGQGLFLFDRNINPLPLPDPFTKVPGMSIWDMSIHSRTGKLWICEQGGRLDVYDIEKNQLQMMQLPVFNSSTIRQVDEDTSGNLWFGTQGGRLIKWDYRKSGGDPTKGYEFVLQTQRIHKVHFDYQGYIWVGTLGSGLLKIDVKTNQIVRSFNLDGPPGERLYQNTVDDMTYYNDSTLILAAGAVHILNTRSNKIRFITSDDGLPSNTAVSVQRDREGIVWTGMTDGIVRINLQKNILSYFDRRDGIVYDKFSSTGVEQLSDGRMAFYTMHNFMVFDPKRIVGSSLPPKPYITGFRLAGQTLSLDSIQHAKRALLRYNNTSIAISFSALTYLQQRKLHYYYMLEGVDKDWIHTDRPIEAIYNYLKPGNYVFRVKSESADGITSLEEATLAITVRAPIWQTWWFFSLIALFAIAILYLLDRERMIKRRSLQQMRSQIALNLHSEVNTALGDINVLSEIAKIKADKDVEQSKEYIDQISGRSRHMIEAMDDMLWSIDPQNDNMKKTVLRIKELTDGLRATADTPIDLIVDNRVQELELDMKRRHDLYFFYKDAIQFILSELACEQIFVNLNKVRGRLLVEILCECKEESTGVGARFRSALAARIRELPSTLEIIEESKSFAVVMYVELK